MSDLPLVLVTEDTDAAPLAWLKERAQVVEAVPSSPEFEAALPDAVGLVVRTYTKVNAALLAASILSLNDPGLRQRLSQFRQSQTERVLLEAL